MADKAKFVGSIRHTEATLQKLFKTEYRTYHQLRILIQLAVGFVLAAAALTVRMDRILQAVLLLAGCLLMIGRDAPAAFQADKAMDARRGKLPHNVCTFFENALTLSGEGSMRLEYSRFHRLGGDNEYLYLFLGRKSVCMIDKSTIQGGTADELKAFAAERTGLSWRRGRSFFTMNLADLRQMIRDHRSR